MFACQTYKPPSSKDIPVDLRVELLKDAPNPVGVLGSKGRQSLSQDYVHTRACEIFKGVGEPPLCMSCSALFAVKRAIEEVRRDIGKEDFFPLCKFCIRGRMPVVTYICVDIGGHNILDM